MKFNRFLQVVLTFVLFVSMASCEKPQVQPTPTLTSTQIPTKTALLGGCSEADLTSVETKNYVSAVIEQLSNPDVTKITLLLSEVQSAYDSLPVCVRDYIEPYNTSLAVVMTTSHQMLSETDPAKLQAYTDALTNALQDNVDNSPLFLNLKTASEILQAQSTSPAVQTSSVPSEATPFLQVTTDASSGREGTQYWKGTFPDIFYQNDSQGTGTLDIEISGISWMVLTYDKISGDITSVEFGMSEQTYKILPSRIHDWKDGWHCPPNDDAVNLPKELGLTGPIWRWRSSDNINMGVQQFSWENECERWVFNYTSDLMTGTLINKGGSCCYQSETNAFHLYKQ